MQVNTKNWPAFLVVMAVVMADQASKAWVMGNARFNAPACLSDLSQCGKIEISGIFDLTMVWNFGMSFGMFQSDGIGRWIMSALMIIIAIGFAVWLLRSQSWLLSLALSLVIGGAIGNVIDRIRYGAVVDFLDFSGLHFPYVFNVADAAVSVGALLLFLDQFLLSDDKQVKTPADS